MVFVGVRVNVFVFVGLGLGVFVTVGVLVGVLVSVGVGVRDENKYFVIVGIGVEEGRRVGVSTRCSGRAVAVQVGGSWR